MLLRSADIKNSMRFQKVTALPFLVLISFFTLYFLFVPTIVSFLCLCPQKDPNWKCTCGCSKCAQRRQATYLSFDVSFGKPPAREFTPSAKDQFCRANSRSSHKSHLPFVSIESASCTCQSPMKDISHELKEFISAIFTWAQTIDADRILALEEFILILEYFPHPYERPG
jgi:hypothetical protein